MDLPIALLSLVGFGISLYLHLSHKEKRLLVCPLGEDCHSVLHSDYNHILYVRNTWWGMLAFLVLFFSGVLTPVTRDAISQGFHVLEEITAITTAVVALYLLCMQFFVIKKLCTWCLAVNTIAIVIAILFLR